jgi:hypothetical protein
VFWTSLPFLISSWCSCEANWSPFTWATSILISFYVSWASSVKSLYSAAKCSPSGNASSM